MTTKQIAEEFFKEFLQIQPTGFGYPDTIAIPYSVRVDIAKQCALASVEQLQKLNEKMFHGYGIGFMGNAIARNDYTKCKSYTHWQEVKSHLKNISA